MDTKAAKSAIRKEIYARRAARTDEEIHSLSLSMKERLTALPEYKDSKVIYAYMDCKHEAETADIIRQAWSEGKRVAVPRVCGQDMIFYYITSFEEDLEDGYFGIREPKERYPAAAEDALMLLPGVAFDEKRHRVGYGGGFYDRFLEAHPKLVTVALALDFQIFPEAPFEPFDILPGKIVTDKRVIA